MSLAHVTTRAYENVHGSLMLSVNAHRHGRAGPTPPLQLQLMTSGLDVGRKRLMATTTLPGARGLATVNVTMSSEYMNNTKWACFFLFVSLFFSFYCFLSWRDSHKGQEVDVGRQGGACDGDA